MNVRVSKTLTLSAAFLAAATLTACSSDDEKYENRTFYCTTQDGTVVDEDRCDNDGSDVDGSSFFIWHASGSGHHYSPGQKVPVLQGQRFAYNDTAARTKWGLPATGRVSNGSVKTGVVGKGGVPGGSKGGAGS